MRPSNPMRAAALPALLLWAAAPVWAGPGDRVEIRDRLFGLSPHTVFVLRESFDDLASYYSHMGVVALIGIDRVTGQETIWPVSRTRVDGTLWAGELPVIENIAPQELPGAVDPYARLREAGAMPLVEGGEADPVDWAKVIVTAPDRAALHFTGGAHLDDMDTAAGFQRMTTALAAFMAALDYPRNGPVSYAHVLEGTGFTPAECTLSAGGLPIPGASGMTIMLIHDCRQEDQHSAWLISILPQGVGAPTP